MHSSVFILDLEWRHAEPYKIGDGIKDRSLEELQNLLKMENYEETIKEGE